MKIKLFLIGSILSFLIFASALFLSISFANYTVTVKSMVSFGICFIFFGIGTLLEIYKYRKSINTNIARTATWLNILGVFVALVSALMSRSGGFLDLWPIMLFMIIVVVSFFLSIILNIYAFVHFRKIQRSGQRFN